MKREDQFSKERKSEREKRERVNYDCLCIGLLGIEYYKPSVNSMCQMHVCCTSLENECLRIK